ncbi:MAG: helix-turn-helix domain-containing protein [Phycisphaerales bacterium]
MPDPARHELNTPARPAAPLTIAEGDKLLRAGEVAEMLAVSARLVWRFRAEGKLPSVALAGATRFRLSDVRRFMQTGL